MGTGVSGSSLESRKLRLSPELGFRRPGRAGILGFASPPTGVVVEVEAIFEIV